MGKTQLTQLDGQDYQVYVSYGAYRGQMFWAVDGTVYLRYMEGFKAHSFFDCVDGGFVVGFQRIFVTLIVGCGLKLRFAFLDIKIFSLVLHCGKDNSVVLSS